MSAQSMYRDLRKRINKLEVENAALLDIMKNHQKIIAAMDYVLMGKGVNFDFSKPEEYYNPLIPVVGEK